jgi:putative membrane protein (TIGR04086 family)
MKTNIFQVIKSAVGAVVVSLLFVLIFTLIIQLFSLSTDVVKPVNQIFKILSIVTGVLIFVRDDKGIVKGGIAGFIAVIITYFLYSAISGTLSISWRFPVEILLGTFSGAISGIIAVNIKSNRHTSS